ncbi:cerebellin-1 [Acipenser ruthenus]|uniref:cerebellin-1 n=1 Tax=Acipenser ruthenus TaxID=7906 RepID=UPI0027412ACD|nr:cerebellin-1 [Acipenser ruthenus]
MKGILILSLLCSMVGSLLAQDYEWGGSEAGEASKDICVTDSASCGCCLMQQRMQRLEWIFNHTMDQLRKDLDQASKRLNDLRASHTAFSAALSTRTECVGPFRDNATLIYKKVFVNQGGAYNEQTGVFTAPRSGVYSFSVTVFSDAGAPGARLNIFALLQRNGQDLAGVHDDNYDDQEDSATQSLALQLHAGDQLSVRLVAGRVVCDDVSHYNTFSGFLVFPTDLL